MSETIKERVAKAIKAKDYERDNLCSEFDCEEFARSAIEAMQETLLAIVAKEEKDFLSPEYATGQPLSSLSERFACRQVAKAIAAALIPL